MRTRIIFCAALLLALAGCRASDRREYPLRGQVLALTTDHLQATIKHDDIKGFMPAMTMPYKVRDGKQLDGLAPGDLVTATLVVVSNDAYLKDVKKVGAAPIDKPQSAAPAASSGFEVVRPGQMVPNATFTDQDGRSRDFASFKGQLLVVTFIYTTCPMPTFCPLMDRHFAALQAKLKDQPGLGVHLLSVSIDPLTDTPSVLKAHAKMLGADAAMWTFLTGNRDDIDQFAMRLGMSVTRAQNDPRDITHTLRTVIVDRRGALAKTYTGNEWTPDKVLTDIKGMAGAN
jgi:protein SCO1/2